jgi:integrase
MKRRGGGSIFRRGGSLWLKYYRDGQPIRESVARALGRLPEAVTEKDAQALLNKRLGAIAGGQPIVLRADRVRVGELLDDLITEYQVNGRRSLARARISVAHLREFFGNARAQALDPARVREYIARRQAPRKTDDSAETPGATNATINRELAALKRALTLAVQGRKILTRPHIPMLIENNARQGFFERDQLEAVQRHLPEAIRPVAAFAYITGWRVSEILSLTWRQVDFGASTVRLEPGTTKNRAGRMFPFTPELRALLEAQRAHTAAVRARTERIIPYVFHREGQSIKSFRGAWHAACAAAGVPGRIFHDFRRTAVRNLERAGVPRSVAMQMVGHKTEAIYRRYAIVNDADLRAAAVKLAAVSDAPKLATGTIAGTIGHGGTR